MSLLSILTGKASVRRNIGGYTFDAVLTEEHTSELEVTDSPVETGESISDHAYMKPKKLKIVGGIGDAVLNPLTVLAGNDSYGGGQSRSITAFELLQKLQESREPFSVQTGMKLYKNMVITSLRVSQDKDTAKVGIFECDLREVIIVDTKTVTYSPSKTKAKQAQPTKKIGEQQAKEVTDEEDKARIRKSLSAVLGDKALAAVKSYMLGD